MTSLALNAAYARAVLADPSVFSESSSPDRQTSTAKKEPQCRVLKRSVGGEWGAMHVDSEGGPYLPAKVAVLPAETGGWALEIINDAKSHIDICRPNLPKTSYWRVRNWHFKEIALDVATHSAPATRVLREIESLRDGWDGPGSLAPSADAKSSISRVVAQAASYMDEAEVEVDPSTGNPALHWFSDDHSFVVSLAAESDGTVLLVASTLTNTSYRQVFTPAHLDRVGRALVDAGVGRRNGPLR